ncbi:TonB-dependent receptor [Pontibacter sp. Tf4]|uniref:TonB-dependent receptor n=1 Tax=Pontibacter sp. Tf4 TaxID=2761620 RepID=UPI00162826B1|nr:TonB-dependent receptor [Pontibacter sp. Tf4]MBB6613181.1 TonB-dependent receptor [Pontibacter sp. Tf4]
MQLYSRSVTAFFIFLAILCLSNTALSQSIGKASISGKIIASSADALAGVTVVIKEAKVGTTTDEKGQFNLLEITPGNYTLVVSMIGFESQEKNIQLKESQNLTINFTLQDKSFDIEGVEVIGKSATTQVNEQAYSVTAISTKELQNSTSDAKEVLNRVSGVRVLEEGGLGSNASFSLNGFSGDQVKFFLNGLPMDNFSSSLSLSDIPVNTIERIEVYKGVVPVWLGTDALGGAVNIITNKKDNYLDASYSVGSFNTHRLSLNGAYTNPANGFTFRGSGNYNYSDNNYKVWADITDKNGNVKETSEVERFHDRYRSATLMLETGWTGRKYADNLLFGLIASGNDKQVQTGATMGKVYGGILRNSQSVVPTLKYSKDNLFTEGLNVSLNTAFNYTKSESIDTLSGVRFNWAGERFEDGSTDGERLRTFTTFDDTDFNSQLNAGYTINSQHSLAFNYAVSYFRRKAFDSEDPDKIQNKYPKALNKHILGLAYKLDLSEKWSTTLFGKMYLLQAETDKEFGFGTDNRRIGTYQVNNEDFGYGVASSYFLLPTLQLKASYEHTYRLPEPDEIFGDGQFINPNPDLGPEQSDNYNLGAAYSFKLAPDHQFNLESSFIYRESTDLIHQSVNVVSAETTYGNLSDVRTVGVEGSMKYQWRDVLHMGGSVTFQDITDQADSLYNDYNGWSPNLYKGSRQPNKPYLFANANAGLTFKDLVAEKSVVGFNYYFNFVENYYLTWKRFGDIKRKFDIPRQTSQNVEVFLNLANGKYNISAECRNLTDARLYDKFYLQKPGRAFYLKLRYVL